MAKSTKLQKHSVCLSCLSEAADAVDLVRDDDLEDIWLGVIESPDAYVVQVYQVVDDDQCDLHE